MSEEQLPDQPEFQTPMMLQYLEIKKQYADCILLYRLGDFYEMFLEDAKEGSQILDITLTARSRGKDGRIPMAGVPYHSVDSYLGKLVQAGKKVAIAEQVSQPGVGNLVERKVIRVVTPGTLLLESELEHKSNNYLMALSVNKKQMAVVLIDLSTGDLLGQEIKTDHWEQLVTDLMSKYAPRECVLAPALYQDFEFLKKLSKFSQLNIFEFKEWQSQAADNQQFLEKFFKVKSIRAVGIKDQVLLQEVLVAVLKYLEANQQQSLTHIKHIKPLVSAQFLQMDENTVRNLELLKTLRDQQTETSFLKSIDQTQTAMGGRLLKNWLLQPLKNKELIEERLNWVEFFTKQVALKNQVRELLENIVDLERLLSRLSLGSGNPRDLKSLEYSLQTILELRALLEDLPELAGQPFFSSEIKPLDKIRELIQDSILEEPNVVLTQGNIMADGVSQELDQLRQQTRSSKEWLSNLEKTERQRTKISSLKVRFNKVFGYYIEVSKSNLELVPKEYQRRQTLVNGERFITPALKEHEDLILNAQERIEELEYELYQELVKKVLAKLLELQSVAGEVARLDVVAGLAELALSHQYVRPQIRNKGKLEIKQGRHPIVEQVVGSHNFVPNDVVLDEAEQQMMLITGPNMAGKSVLMRQVALIVLMAHLGSFVPAQAARIPLTDQIFVRSGASDVLGEGLSTFMVEMTEAAYILKHATASSLVIMDEIGRGTSTYDGISIASAIAEELVKQQPGPKTLFATHYHELQKLAEDHPQIKNYHLSIEQYQGEPVFLYSLAEGGAGHSFGIAVAQMAGLPTSVITKAKKLLAEMEQKS